MTPARQISGLHHVTAITADAQTNIDFYTGVLGLRLVKLTVNFDDPGSYHLYYGDDAGSPGTIMTFFAWPGAARGRIGPPQVTGTSFAVPAGGLDYWSRRLLDHKIKPEQLERFGEGVLSFDDPDGLHIELVGVLESPGEPSGGGTAPPGHAIRAFYGVTIAEEGHRATAALLTGVMGYRQKGNDQNRYRYRAGSAGMGPIVDVLCKPDMRRGAMGAGVVHHVAFATPDDDQQRAWYKEIGEQGFNVSPVMDRCYFHSIYFREPGGVLFEIATEGPGFAVDEPFDRLGSRLKLPPWLESQRADIEQALPPVRLPGVEQDRDTHA